MDEEIKEVKGRQEGGKGGRMEGEREEWMKGGKGKGGGGRKEEGKGKGGRK